MHELIWVKIIINGLTQFEIHNFMTQQKLI